MRTTALALSLSLTLTAAACRPAPVAAPESALAPSTAFVARMRLFDAQGREVALHDALDSLAQRSFVMFGETHLDETTHALELAVLAGIAERRGGAVALSMEMFERDVQPTLDAYLAGAIDEAAFLAASRPWGNYATDYRPLVEHARAHAIPVIAANLPRPRVRALAGGGAQAYAQARREHPTEVPRELFPGSASYWARVDRATRGHGGGSGTGDRLHSIQNYWDNAMAEACTDARVRWPDRTVVHVAGSFHVAHREGTVAQVRQRAPQASIGTIVAVPVHDLADITPDPTLADFVAYVRADASGPDGGRLSVAMPATLDWRLSLPNTAVGATRLPLVVWLPADDERPEDAQRRLEAILGDRAIAVVVEPPHAYVASDGSIARRFALPGSFVQDAGPVAAAIADVVAYARRRLPVDGDRIVLAGEGSGAAVALWTAMHDATLAVDVVAIAPVLPHALQQAALSDEPSGARSVAIHTADPAAPAVAAVVATLREVGLSPDVSARATGDVHRDDDAVVARAVGIAAADAQTPATTITIAIAIPEDAPAAARWAVAIARGIERDDPRARATVTAAAPGTPTLDLRGAAGSVRSAAVLSRSDARLPSPPAAFGGATIVVLPEGIGDAAVAAWTPVVAAAAQARGRMAPLRLVAIGQTPTLGETIAELADAGTSEILVVPAVFAAGIDAMQALHDAAGAPPDGVTLHWLSGMGAAAARAWTADDTASALAAQGER